MITTRINIDKVNIRFKEFTIDQVRSISRKLNDELTIELKSFPLMLFSNDNLHIDQLDIGKIYVEKKSSPLSRKIASNIFTSINNHFKSIKGEK